MALIRDRVEGQIISRESDFDLPPGARIPARISSYMQYGPYSGVDIKVIVHMPHPSKDTESAAENAVFDAREERDRLQQIQREEESKLQSSYPPSSRRDTLQRIISAREATEASQLALNQAEENYENIIGFPKTKVLAELHTLSYSIYREKSPVRTLGSVYPRAYVRGPRTIGGSMIFTVFNKHVLHEILDMNLGYYNTGTSDHDKYLYTTNLPDQLPPLDLTLLFANEYGAISTMGLYGVEFVQEGTTFSIEDLFSENVVQYVARDLDPMRDIEYREIDNQGVTKEWFFDASRLSKQKEYNNGYKVRRDPFI